MQYPVDEKYVYPYQQAIGFYLQQARYASEQFESFKTIQSSYKFYLDYNMVSPVLNNYWNIMFRKICKLGSNNNEDWLVRILGLFAKNEQIGITNKNEITKVCGQYYWG